MKILESQSATLTNQEVLTHLLSLSTHKPSASTSTTSPAPTIAPALKAPNFETIRTSLLEYLSPPRSSDHSPAPPSPLPDYTSPLYSSATTKELLQRLKKYDLSKAELLMLMNLRPRDLGLLDCVVEECDERFGVEEQEGILRVVGGEGVGGEGDVEMA
ncbi:hypothetical protein MMC18_004157 [Xylographa bjoerkii]|nr:hypothetical protein [Xylographa bjoerkii]